MSNLGASHRKGTQVFSAEHHRAKAAEIRSLLTRTPQSPQEKRELRNLEHSYTTLAENEEWMAVNIHKTIQPEPR